MKAMIDQRKCNGAGICVQELPSVFRFQEGSKKAVAVPEQVPETLGPRLRKVARECPANAVVVIED